MKKIIAEIGSVHDGNIKLAYQLIKKAVECGADIINSHRNIGGDLVRFYFKLLLIKSLTCS